MTDRKDGPESKAAIRKGDAARAERLKVALRENLKRRKAQARARADAAAPAHESAGFVPDKPKG